eukprot:TRINITY_DN29931_c0_g1_i1.p1 TRINITY_DN29931_c0_g1~~TRINITY_DN29931_c0_g1_i1.p1  ORF type:complete len:298 (+),score=64.47 TRINITY_DN29931_c0_g1_i1:78-971(+)
MCDLKLGVALSFAISIVSNALSATGVIGKQNIGQISDDNPTYVTPDGLTFSIWGVIYTLETVLVVAQYIPSEHAEELLGQECPLTGLTVRGRLILAFLANAIWLPFYVNLYFSIALIIIFVYLGALISVYTALNPTKTESFCEWLLYAAGIACNGSWVVVATSANSFTVAGEFGWKDEFGVAGTPLAALVVVVLVAILGSAMALFNKDLAWSLVAAWALAGVQRMQTIPDPERFPVDAMNSSLAAGAKWSMVGVVIASVLAAGMAAKDLWLKGQEANLLQGQTLLETRSAEQKGTPE